MKTFISALVAVVGASAAIAVFVLGLHSANPHAGAARHEDISRITAQLEDIQQEQRLQRGDIRTLLTRIPVSP